MLADAKGIGHSSCQKAPKSDGSISLFPSLFHPPHQFTDYVGPISPMLSLSSSIVTCRAD